MDDLFRFLMLRPAVMLSAQSVNDLQPGFAPPDATPQALRRAASAHLEKKGTLRRPDELAFGSAAQAVISALAAGARDARELDQVVEKAAGKPLERVLADPAFARDEVRLADCLAAMKLTSTSAGRDAPALARLMQAYDAMRLAGQGMAPVMLRPLSVSALPPQVPAARGKRPPARPPERGPDASPSPEQIETAISVLQALTASAFDAGATPRPGGRDERGPRRAVTAAAAEEEVEPGTSLVRRGPSRAWMLAKKTVEGLPSGVRETLRALKLDALDAPLPALLEHLQQARLRAPLPEAPARVLDRVGSGMQFIDAQGYVGEPTSPMPDMPGSVRPIGIGDLLVVREHALRYEGGDLAHVENVLKTEHLERETRRLQRNETSVVLESEDTREEQRDTQTTDRFSLKRETSDTIKTDTQFKAGLTVTAKYGPTVEVKANAEFSSQVAKEESAKQASEFSKDVVARSVSRLVERVLERRSSTTINEFEERYKHGFDNTGGAANVSGFYQWIDKILEAQVYNYGRRMLFDLTLPEPATHYILMQAGHGPAPSLAKPEPFMLAANAVLEGNYRYWARKYDATGIEPPPALFRTVSKAIDGSSSSKPYEHSKSESLPIEDGYRAKYALVTWGCSHYPPESHWHLIVGDNIMDVLSDSDHYLDLASETGAVGFASNARKVRLHAATIEIFCERTLRAFQAWQLKVHAAITQAYQAKLQAYESALAQARAAAGVTIAGRNPLFNERIIAAELRKQCITLLTAQQFDAFGALELSAEGYAQPDLAAVDAQMPYVRFFEQAFEWEHIVYFFYPYFWAWKGGWKERMLMDDVDSRFADFLRAGAARVVFPVRPGFEAAVVHYLETGEIWSGGPPPDIASPLYVPIIQEIQEANGAPGGETAVGESWEVRVPTTLVQLRPNGDLPRWGKVDGRWQPAN